MLYEWLRITSIHERYYTNHQLDHCNPNPMVMLIVQSAIHGGPPTKIICSIQPILSVGVFEQLDKHKPCG